MANWLWFNNVHKGVWSGTNINFGSDTIKCSLHTVTYVPNQDTHDFYDDVTNEVTGTGYTAGGVTLAGKSVTYDGTSNEVRFLFTDPAWTTATISGIRVAVIRKDTGTASTSPLIAYTVLAADDSVTNGTYTLDVDATAVLKITAS